jgi:hypothetical protein
MCNATVFQRLWVGRQPFSKYQVLASAGHYVFYGVSESLTFNTLQLQWLIGHTSHFKLHPDNLNFKGRIWVSIYCALAKENQLPSNHKASNTKFNGMANERGQPPSSLKSLAKTGLLRTFGVTNQISSDS